MSIEQEDGYAPKPVGMFWKREICTYAGGNATTISRSFISWLSQYTDFHEKKIRYFFACLGTICVAVLHSLTTDRNKFYVIKATKGLFCALWRGKWEALVQPFW